ncbi:DNA-packaging protein FI [Escherichia coli]|nr:DNA-packaging protein FI [Escherichia coli]
MAFVLPGTAFRVSAGVAAEMTERGTGPECNNGRRCG